MTLKSYHMAQQLERDDVSEEHVRICREKLGGIEEQRRDLAQALGLLLSDLGSGRKRLKPYRQFKMYNDPNLNPALYEKRR